MAFLDEAGVSKLWSLFLTKLKGFAPMSHVEDTDIHVTKTEKETWSGLGDNIRLKKNLVARLPVIATWDNCAFGNNVFVVLSGNDNKAVYSADGITWTQTTLPSSNNWRSVCFGDGKFVAVVSGSNKAAYSTDGVTWTATTLPVSSGWSFVTYGNGKFVAITNNSSNAAYSTDGIKWTKVTLPIAGSYNGVAYGNGKFVAIIKNAGVFITSSDGVTWDKSIHSKNYNWSDITFGSGKFIVIAYSSSKVIYSSDGSAWTESNMPLVSSWEAITYGNGKFVAISLDSNVVAYSTDGITWTQGTLPTTGKWVDIINGNGEFVAIKQNSDSIAISYDGITWFSEATYTDVQYSELSSETKEKMKPFSTKITLSSSKWSNLSQTVIVDGVLSDESAQIIFPVPSSASREAYENAGIKLSAQAENSLTFTADTVPTVSLTVYVVVKDVVDVTPPVIKYYLKDNPEWKNLTFNFTYANRTTPFNFIIWDTKSSEAVYGNELGDAEYAYRNGSWLGEEFRTIILTGIPSDEVLTWLNNNGSRL